MNPGLRRQAGLGWPFGILRPNGRRRTIQEFHEMALLATHQRGYQLAVHAVGDKAVKVTIDGFINAIQTLLTARSACYVLHGSMGIAKISSGGEIRHYLVRTTLPSGSAYDYEGAGRRSAESKGEIGKGLKRYHRPWRHGGGRLRRYGSRQLAANGAGGGHAQIGVQRQVSARAGDKRGGRRVPMYAINAAYQEFSGTGSRLYRSGKK